ncbi:RNA polymerase sigma factor [Paenibacillus contaminans]|uniref:RNA polymerase sigma factor n=1 Tax=Paenibacillus contaminans TaxID=450362 RepID=UPI001EDCD6F1|nr:RNA polymerase sigma factor [Paenibacillus contaminans]
MEEGYLRYINQLDYSNYRRIVERYWKDVWNYAFFITKHYEWCDDIAQDVFFQAYKHLSTFRGQSTVKTWLLKITRNISFNYKKAAFFKKVTLIGLVAPNQTSPSAEEQFFKNDLSDQIWERVLHLKPVWREVLILDAAYQLSTKEIAHLLGIGEGAVKSRIHRARLKMSKMLKEEADYETE